MPPYLLGWTIIRPPLVYGPKVRGNFLRLLRLAEFSLRVPVPMMGSSNRRSLVFLGNLTHLARTSLTHPSAVGETFLVRESEDVSKFDLLRRLAAAMGGRARVLRLPDGFVRRALSVPGRSAEAQRLFGSFTVDASHAERMLGWKPPSSLDRGLELTAGWWRALGAS